MQSQLNSKTSLGNILGDYQNKKLIIPQFQRGYSWELKQVSEFWNDLTDHLLRSTSNSYFFGPMVINEQENEIEILDGQQRLATATMLLCAIRDIARKLNHEPEDKKFNKGNDLARDIQTKEVWLDEDEDTFKLTLGELDQAFFQGLIQSDPPQEIQPTLKSHELIKKNYLFLIGNIENELKAFITLDEKISYLKKLRKALVSQFVLYIIPVNNEEEAFQIFETLNDRGIRLSVPDLLLNYLMRVSPTRQDREKVRKAWDKILENLGKKDISKFIRHAWVSRYGDLKARGLFTELKSYLKTGNISSLSFVNSVVNDCNLYISLTEQRDIPEESAYYVRGIIKYLNVQSAIPLLLSAISVLKEAEFVSLCSVVSKLCVKYITIAGDNPDIIESKFYHLAREIREQHRNAVSTKVITRNVIKELKTLDPDNKRIEDKLHTVILSRGESIYVLNQLTLSSITTTKEIRLDKVNLEHIFPQNAKITDWPNMEQLEKHVWKFGNLTILGEKLNQKAANSSFEKKKQDYYKNS